MSRYQGIADIVEEACKGQAEKLLTEIRRLVEERMPGQGVVVIEPWRDWPYAAVSGPKPLGDGRHDMSTTMESWTLPICHIEFPARSPA